MAFALRALAARAVTRSARPLAAVSMRNVSRTLCVGAAAGDFPVGRSWGGQQRDSSTLQQVLQRELEEEQNMYTQNQSLNDVQAKLSKYMTLVDEPGNMEVRLEREYNGEQVTVRFDCETDTGVMPDLDGLDEEGAEHEHRDHGDEEEERSDLESMENPIPFTVEIVKDNKGIQFSCFAEESEMVISRVRHMENVAEDEEAAHPYTGPNFEELDDELQDAFIQYLDERGITDDIAVFIENYAETKEQKEYCTFLEKVTDFVRA